MRLTLHVLFDIAGGLENFVARVVQTLLGVVVGMSETVLRSLRLALRRVFAVGDRTL